MIILTRFGPKWGGGDPLYPESKNQPGEKPYLFLMPGVSRKQLGNLVTFSNTIISPLTRLCGRLLFFPETQTSNDSKKRKDGHFTLLFIRMYECTPDTTQARKAKS